jgi:predicted SAM-dependent methyltransferase
MKYNFGCGSNRIFGWQNFDADCDITKPLPFSDNSAEFILAEHVCEHIAAPDCLRFFEECHRLLSPGGVLRICVPHLDRIQDTAHCRDLIVGHGHMVVFNLSNLVTMLQLAGFESVSETLRKPCDGHWKIIGEAKDDLETLRVEARKAA